MSIHKFEYKITSLPSTAEEIDQHMFDMGQNEWELVSVYNGIMFWKKPETTLSNLLSQLVDIEIAIDRQ